MRWFAVLALAWTLGGCMAVLPEAARQFKAIKEMVPWGQPATPNDQRLAELGDTTLLGGDYTLAETYLDAALAINPYNTDALRSLATVYRITGRPGKARALDATVLASSRDDRAPAPPLEVTGANPGQHDAQAKAAPEPTPRDAERAALNRFATLARLRDAGLISRGEYSARREANLGALLPLTGAPPSPALARPTPHAQDVIERLQTIAAFHRAGGLSDAELANERAAIVDSLMPVVEDGTPAAAATAPPPQLERLDWLLAANLISAEEHRREREAMLGSAEPRAVADTASAAPEPAPALPDDEAAAAQSAEGELGVHLASFRTPERARRGWDELHAAHGDVLDGLEPRIARIDLGVERGVFYRLGAVPLADETAARALCNELKQRRVYCAPKVF